MLLLPREIHLCVMEELSRTDIKSVVFLGLTCSYFWNLARPRICRFYETYLGRWAGSNLICVGDYTEYEDLPRGLLTEEDDREARTGFTDPKDRKRFGDDAPLSLYIIASARFHPLPEYIGVPRILNEKTERDLLSSKNREPKPADFKRVVCPEFSDFYPTDRPWVLRNLTTHEYVRAEAIAIKKEYIHGPHIDYFGFGEVVVSRICRSSDPSVSMNTSIIRGPWAGHAFDIVPEDQLREDKNVEWKDVSREVSHYVSRIWSNEFGDEWSEELPKMSWMQKLYGSADGGKKDVDDVGNEIKDEGGSGYGGGSASEGDYDEGDGISYADYSEVHDGADYDGDYEK